MMHSKAARMLSEQNAQENTGGVFQFQPAPKKKKERKSSAMLE